MGTAFVTDRSGERPRWFLRAEVWRLVALAAGLVVVAGYAFLVYHHGSSFGRTDLEIYRAGTDIALAGRSPYGLEILPLGPFLYPPFAVLVMAAFTAVPLGAAQVLWVGVNIAAVLTIARIVVARFDLPDESLRSPLATALGLISLCTAPVWLTIIYGQVNIVLALLIVADTLVPRPRWPRGLLVGLAIGIKLTPAIFVVWWLLTGRRREAAVATSTFVVTVVAGLLLMGDVGIEYWTDIALELPARVSLDHILNQSAYAMFLRFESPAPRQLALLVGALVVVVGLLRARLSSAEGHDLTAVAICGAMSVLVAPVSWVHHGVWIPIAAMTLVGRAVGRDEPGPLFAASALVLASVAYFSRAGDWWVREIGWSPVPALAREWFFFMGVGIVVLLPYRPAHSARVLRLKALVPSAGGG